MYMCLLQPERQKLWENQKEIITVTQFSFSTGSDLSLNRILPIGQ